LSEEWLAAVPAPDVAPVPGEFSGVVLVIVTGGPDGEARHLVTYEDGRPVAATGGGDGDWVVSLTLVHADARAVLDGDADLNALFMAGRMKVAGDATAPLLDLLRATKAPALQAARVELAAATD